MMIGIRFVPQFSLALIFCIHSLATLAGSCFPDRILINGSERIDEVSEMSVYSYDLSSEFNRKCENLPLKRSLQVEVAKFSPESVASSIETTKRGDFVTATGAQWNIRINASYFNKKGEPTLYLKNKDDFLGRPLSRRGGVFHCSKNSCAITPASRFEDSEPNEIAVQATPRLIYGGDYTSGVHGPNVVDERMILAIDKDDQVLILYSRAASFNEIRRFLLTELEVKEALALDGGSSTSFHLLSRSTDGEEFKIDDTHFFWVQVPFFLNFFWPQ